MKLWKYDQMATGGCRDQEHGNCKDLNSDWDLQWGSNGVIKTKQKKVTLKLWRTPKLEIVKWKLQSVMWAATATAALCHLWVLSMLLCCSVSAGIQEWGVRAYRAAPSRLVTISAFAFKLAWPALYANPSKSRLQLFRWYEKYCHLSHLVKKKLQFVRCYTGLVWKMLMRSVW